MFVVINVIHVCELLPIISVHVLFHFLFLIMMLTRMIGVLRNTIQCAIISFDDRWDLVAVKTIIVVGSLGRNWLKNI